MQGALKWLERSHTQCQLINLKSKLSDDDFDKLENLTSRFARVTDLLINKMYRAIDLVEFKQPGSLIDTINNAEKKQLIDSVEQARTLKDIRNEIAHEYILEDQLAMFNEVLEQTSQLITLSKKAISYSEQYTG
ncbi:MAG: hypothetical protein COB35_06775 [Gammaproteobacteria bacterium]|nr:MAG: hypothetical protein COB35_06775 [Gammaproteobacteria bacterium]